MLLGGRGGLLHSRDSNLCLAIRPPCQAILEDKGWMDQVIRQFGQVLVETRVVCGMGSTSTVRSCWWTKLRALGLDWR